MNTTCFTFSSTQTGHAAWAPNPSCRGTFDIVSLCISTTIICIWSSIHWDIALERLDDDLDDFDRWRITDIIGRLKNTTIIAYRSVLRHGPLVLVAILCPELWLYHATNQLLCARNLHKDVSKILENQAISIQSQLYGSQKKPFSDVIQMERRSLAGPAQHNDQRENSQRFKFTLVHAFYAIMGGFAFTLMDLDGTVGQERAKLTPKGIRFLLTYDPRVIPDLSVKSITERSGSTSLGKALLIFQVARFCFNCASRLRKHLPLSLLEVSTLAHGFMTLLCYFVWWFKPLNINEPTWIPMGDERAREALALVQVFGWQKDSDPPQQLRDIAAKAAERYGPSIDDFLGEPDPFFTSGFSPRFKGLFSNFGIGTGAMDDIVTVSIPIAYGLLHFLGWYTQFPSTTERKLWHTATLVVMSSGAVATMFFIGNRKLRTRLRAHKIFDTVLFYIIPFIYMIGSMYLLVESIRQLWYVPPKAYAVG